MINRQTDRQIGYNPLMAFIVFIKIFKSEISPSSKHSMILLVSQQIAWHYAIKEIWRILTSLRTIYAEAQPPLGDLRKQTSWLSLFFKSTSVARFYQRPKGKKAASSLAKVCLPGRVEIEAHHVRPSILHREHQSWGPACLVLDLLASYPKLHLSSHTVLLTTYAPVLSLARGHRAASPKFYFEQAEVWNK